MNFSLYIAKRYLFTKSKNNAINIISIIAAFGVIVGSASLFIVLSGFSGLKDFSLQFSSYSDPDLKLFPAYGKSLMFTDDDVSKLKQIEGVVSFSKIIEERVVLINGTKNKILTLKGVDENYPQSTIDSMLHEGEWMAPNMNQIVVGWDTSTALSIGVFDFSDALKIYVPKPGQGQLSFTSLKSAYNVINVANSGVFSINPDIDNSVIFTNYDTAKQLLGYKENQVSTIEISTNSDIDTIKSAIETAFGNEVILKTRAQLNDALYKMLNTENLAVYLIFTLILIIALFNVIGAIIMMILDQKKNLNTLYNLGASITDIRRIFFLQGTLMTLVGGCIGVFIGVILICNQIYGPQALKIMLTPSLAYPARLSFTNFFVVIITISILGILASKIATKRITKSLVTHNS
ncbi:MAG: ABC transporter permease [Flavobacteriaceae bacterium]|nr:ABC transporter permease [Flavobacteriaceae bacterium]